MTGLKQNISKALANKQLGQAVLKSTTLSVTKRDKIVTELPDLEEARSKAREIRWKSLEKIDELLDVFEKSFSVAGGHVHYAADGDEACRVITDILQNNSKSSGGSGTLKGVKSKSMVSEEICLRQALENAGIDAVESDLGEFIVQLAEETPSHITAPALHMSRQDIGRLFQKKLDIPYYEDPEILTRTARRVLRDRFVNAEFGISGANFVIAESGHIVIVENEGNARLGLSLPPVYIALTGIEKVLESLDDLPALTDLLPRSATGQRTTTYLNLLRPTRNGEDGPGGMHVVLVDNGRRRALEDERMREMLLCIRCGACLNICPVYQSVGGHAYGSIYPGPMGAVMSNLISVNPEDHAELPYLSTLCGACRDICPVKIDIPRMLLELRSRCKKLPIEQAAAKGFSWVMSTSMRYEMGGKLARAAVKLLPAPNEWLKGTKTSFRE